MSSSKQTSFFPQSNGRAVLLTASAAGVCAGCAAFASWLSGFPAAVCWFAAGCAALAAAGGRGLSLVLSGREAVVHQPAVVDALVPILPPAASTDDARVALEQLVRARLPCDAVELHLRENGVGLALTPQASGAHAIARSAQRSEHEIVAPISFEGVLFGQLLVQRRRAARGFTGQDAALLNEIATASGLMVAHAVAYSELEQRRRQQAAAFRDEREALVETLSAEIAHEVRYPINFFRSIFQRASEDRVLDGEDLEIGSEEVDRLERLVSGLRRMAIHVDRRMADVAELASRAEVLLRDRMERKRMTLDLGAAAALRCDVDKITQVLVNLVANALDATEERGEIGIDWRLTAHGGELLVWDTGPGFSGDATRLFAPWYTTKPRGTGLGLAIAYRMIRAHGWMIEGTRREGRTVFAIAIPLGDVSTGARHERKREHASGEELVSTVVSMPIQREGAA